MLFEDHGWKKRSPNRACSPNRRLFRCLNYRLRKITSQPLNKVV